MTGGPHSLAWLKTAVLRFESRCSSQTLRSVGQLAPQPDLTRQCAFDLRSRLEILSTPPDGTGRSFNVSCTERGSRPALGLLPEDRPCQGRST